VDQNEVTRWPENGQFWAQLEPLALVQVTAAGHPSNTCISTILWTPDGVEEEAVFTSFSTKYFRYLWHQLEVTQEEFNTNKPTPVPGDVWIEARTKQLIFIGPSDQPLVSILSDWEVLGWDHKFFPYQLMPRNTEIPNRYRKLLEA
jgi:hypothetical protein